MTLLEIMQKGGKAPYDVIDMHGHLGRSNYGMHAVEPKYIVEGMDRMGIRSILVSPLQCLGWDVHWGNDRVAQAIREFPGRLLGYCALFPSSQKEVEKECILRKKQGFMGFKYHNFNGFAYDDPAYAPSWAMAEEFRMPLLYHVWGETQVLREIANVAEKIHRAPILLGHSTSCNMEGYISTAKAYPNVYLELCGSSVAFGSVEKLVKAVGAEKVVWGSDCHFYSETQQFGRIAGCHLSEEDKQTILSRNALRILGKS